jgi:hypothetical protein
LLWPDLKERSRSKETDIEFHKKVYLTQDYWRRIRFRPSKCKTHWSETFDDCRHDYHSAFNRGEIAAQLDSLRLLVQSNPSCCPIAIGKTLTAAPVSSSPFKEILV